MSEEQPEGGGGVKGAANARADVALYDEGGVVLALLLLSVLLLLVQRSDHVRRGLPCPSRRTARHRRDDGDAPCLVDLTCSSLWCRVLEQQST